MCKENYVQPTMRETPTHMILHVEMNDVPSKKDPDKIAENIVNLAIKLKINCNVSISGITARSYQYQKNAVDASRKLKRKVLRKKFTVINFHDVDPYHIETTPMICRANQWAGFYLIGTHERVKP